MNEELSTAHKSIGISCEIIYGSMWYIEEGMSSAPRAEIQPCSDITLVLSHFPQASDTMVDPRMGELARSCCSNTSPILPHPCLQGVWCFLPETSYLVYSKYFLSFLCGRHQSQPSCISSRTKVSSLHIFHGCYSLWFKRLLSACGLLLG